MSANTITYENYHPMNCEKYIGLDVHQATISLVVPRFLIPNVPPDSWPFPKAASPSVSDTTPMGASANQVHTKLAEGIDL